jgi:hypothetical protein
MVTHQGAPLWQAACNRWRWMIRNGARHRQGNSKASVVRCTGMRQRTITIHAAGLPDASLRLLSFDAVREQEPSRGQHREFAMRGSGAGLRPARSRKETNRSAMETQIAAPPATPARGSCAQAPSPRSRQGLNPARPGASRPVVRHGGSSITSRRSLWDSA